MHFKNFPYINTSNAGLVSRNIVLSFTKKTFYAVSALALATTEPSVATCNCASNHNRKNDTASSDALSQ